MTPSSHIPDLECVTVIAQTKPRVTNRGGLASYVVLARVVDPKVQGGVNVTYLFIHFVVFFNCRILIYLCRLQMQSGWTSIVEIVGGMLI